MRRIEDPRKMYQGIGIGLLLPIVSYFLISLIFYGLVQMGLMDASSDSISTRRMRTIALFAICANMIPLQFFKKKKYAQSIKGIVIATMIMAGLWLVYFYDTLFV